ncbi:MAG: hypothetical protein R2806_14530 [Saprospiraceae bacterium]
MIISHFAITPGFSQKYGPSKIGSPVMPGEYKVNIRTALFKVSNRNTGKLFRYSASVETTNPDGSKSKEKVEAVPYPEIAPTAENKLNEETQKNFIQKLFALFKKKGNKVMADPTGHGDYHPGGEFPDGPITIIFTPDEQGLPPRSRNSKTFKYANAQEFNSRFLLEVEAYLKAVYSIN